MSLSTGLNSDRAWVGILKLPIAYQSNPLKMGWKLSNLQVLVPNEGLRQLDYHIDTVAQPRLLEHR